MNSVWIYRSVDGKVSSLGYKNKKIAILNVLKATDVLYGSGSWEVYKDTKDIEIVDCMGQIRGCLEEITILDEEDKNDS